MSYGFSPQKKRHTGTYGQKELSFKVSVPQNHHNWRDKIFFNYVNNPIYVICYIQMFYFITMLLSKLQYGRMVPSMCFCELGSNAYQLSIRQVKTSLNLSYLHLTHKNIYTSLNFYEDYKNSPGKVLAKITLSDTIWLLN